MAENEVMRCGSRSQAVAAEFVEECFSHSAGSVLVFDFGVKTGCVDVT